MTMTLARIQATVEETTRKGAAHVLEQVEELAERAPMLCLVFDRAAPAMRELVRAESDLAGVWLETTRDQVRLTLETMQRLALARDWTSLLTIQAEFMRESMARLQDGVLRQMRITTAMTTTLMAPRDAELTDAA